MWAGYLIITVLLFVIAAIAGLLGLKALKKAKANTVPQKAIRNAQETVAAIKPRS
nr:phage holin family protein [Janibacter limosus]